jgi:hypothetical protein
MKGFDMKHYRLLLGILFCSATFACAHLLNIPIEKELSSWQIPKSRDAVVKKTILNNGFERITNDNYPYEGALVTQYRKEIATKSGANSSLHLLMSFKDSGPDSTFYRNIGITLTFDRTAPPEVSDEANRMEEILYEKLIEVAGKENVVRGGKLEAKPAKQRLTAPYIFQPRAR